MPSLGPRRRRDRDQGGFSARFANSPLVETTFEAWPIEPGPFKLIAAARSHLYRAIRQE
jgi:hypothetical protein